MPNRKRPYQDLYIYLLRDLEWFILSGLMRSQARDLKMLLVKYGLQVVDEWDSEMTWYTMLVRR